MCDYDCDESQADGFNEGDDAALAYARQRYPDAPDLQAAFVKFVHRSLKHSKEDDKRQDNEISLLLKRVNSLQDQVKTAKEAAKKASQKIDESTDYLEEK